MEKELEKSGQGSLEKASNTITSAIYQSMFEYFDVFTQLLSTIVWQSPAELCIKLIEMTAPEEWDSLQDNQNDTIEIKRRKESYRKGVLMVASNMVGHIGKQANILQRMSTRLLVQETLAETLPHNDQDRIIAAELGLGFRNWKRVLATIVTHDIVTPERVLVESPYSHTDEHGRYVHVLSVNDHIDPIESIPELPIIHTQMGRAARVGPMVMMASMNVSQLLLDESVLARHDNMLGSREDESSIRSTILKNLGNVPAFKKRSIGNHSQRPEPKAEWKPHGA